MPLNVTYRYDEADVVTGCAGSFAKGRLTRVVESKGGLVYCNDPHGNVVTNQAPDGSMVHEAFHIASYDFGLVAN